MDMQCNTHEFYIWGMVILDRRLEYSRGYTEIMHYASSRLTAYIVLPGGSITHFAHLSDT